MAEKSGLPAALAELEAEGVIDAPPRPAQILLPGLVDPASDSGAALAGAEHVGPGRPPGARNRNTEAWRDWLLGPGKASPLERLSVVAQANTVALAKAWGAKALDVAKLQVNAAIGLAPYVHQKMPLALQVEGGGLVPVMVFGEMPEGMTVRETEDGLFIEGEMADEDEQNQ